MMEATEGTTMDAEVMAVDVERVASGLRTGRAGLTLVEIMIVLTIMASIMGVVGFFAKGALDNANIRTAETEVTQLSQMVTQYYVFRNEYPDTLEQLVNPPRGMAPITEAIPNDPWGRPYIYRKTNTGYEIRSMGPDGSDGGGDDICPANQNCN